MTAFNLGQTREFFKFVLGCCNMNANTVFSPIPSVGPSYNMEESEAHAVK